MSFKFKGTVHSVGQTQVVSDKFSKREIVISDETSKYPEPITFEFSQDKCVDLDSVEKGMIVEISFNLSGRLWQNPQTNIEKGYNTLKGWKITKGESENAPY
jgi:hypothetical protein